MRLRPALALTTGSDYGSRKKGRTAFASTAGGRTACDIQRLRNRLDDYLNARAFEVKQSRDGAGLPLEILRANLTGNDHCLCHVVARLLGDPSA